MTTRAHFDRHWDHVGRRCEFVDHRGQCRREGQSLLVIHGLSPNTTYRFPASPPPEPDSGGNAQWLCHGHTAMAVMRA